MGDFYLDGSTYRGIKVRKGGGGKISKLDKITRTVIIIVFQGLARIQRYALEVETEIKNLTNELSDIDENRKGKKVGFDLGFFFFFLSFRFFILE
jgi:hypothetical protein